MVLLWAVLNVPSLSLEELKTIVETASDRDIEVSVSLISRELDNIGMSRKQLQYFSMNRDEADRVAFWINPPDHAVGSSAFLTGASWTSMNQALKHLMPRGCMGTRLSAWQPRRGEDLLGMVFRL